MPREIPIGTVYREALETRFRNVSYGEPRTLLDTVLPVQQLGHRDFSDQERPDYWIHGSTNEGHANRYGSVTLTSSVDIAVEEVALSSLYWDTSGTPQWVYSEGWIDGFTPSTSYNPMYQDLVYWYPGHVPRRKWNYNTVLIGARTPTPLPFNPGQRVYVRVNLIALIGAVGNSPHVERIVYDPPVILPAGIFMTWQAVDLQYGVEASFRYREIG